LTLVTNVGSRIEVIPPTYTWQPGGVLDVPVQVAQQAHHMPQFQVDWGEEVKSKTNGKLSHLTWISNLDSHNGYGIFSIAAMRLLRDRGIHISVHQQIPPGIRERLKNEEPDILEMVERQDKFPTRLGLLIGHLQDLKLLPTPVRILDLMYETTEVPQIWDPFQRDADAIIVPCQQQVEIFRRVGWKNPIHTVPCMFELALWPAMNRPPRDTFTFGCWARLSSRKMPLEIVQCFQRAFPDKDDVRLIMKTRNNDFGGGQVGAIPTIKDPRVTIINAEWTHQQMLDMVQSVDCGIFLSHGEGMYHGPVQAMATGIPCITPDNSGFGMYAKSSHGWIVGNDPTRPFLDAEGMGFRNGKSLQWWNPSLDETIAHMRYAYEHPREVEAKGKKAQRFVRKAFAEETIAKQLLDVLNIYA